MKKQTPMTFVDRFMKNLANLYDEQGDTQRANDVRGIHKQFEGLLEQESQIIHKAFVDGYESELNAHSTKSQILSQLYYKENFL